ncbi:M48 family metallopeptidase [Paraburkholderia sp.]|uniref:M48 family metallopeptidase n=1 Tax=Paraburkholderia sp. TaxID=1926495 RepID=UPI003C7ADA75
MKTLSVNDLRFQVRRSAVRRSLEITVDRDGNLILAAPLGVDDAVLRDFVLRKRMWVYKQLARREAFSREVRRKEFVDGEGFLYLGRSYRLRLVPELDVPLKLQSGRFLMSKRVVREARQQLIRWYCDRGARWLSEKVEEYAARMEVSPAGVRVQDLGYRWGSCGKGSRLYFHWKTILLPARIAEYVVVHEMAHLHEPHHTPEFWRRVERAMPDFERRRTWLAEHGIEIEGI